jgi:hypothetical protein
MGEACSWSGRRSDSVAMCQPDRSSVTSRFDEPQLAARSTGAFARVTSAEELRDRSASRRRRRRAGSSRRRCRHGHIAGRCQAGDTFRRERDRRLVVLADECLGDIWIVRTWPRRPARSWAPAPRLCVGSAGILHTSSPPCIRRLARPRPELPGPASAAPHRPKQQPASGPKGDPVCNRSRGGAALWADPLSAGRGRPAERRRVGPRARSTRPRCDRGPSPIPPRGDGQPR